MESPLDDFPSEPIADSSGSTLDVSQNQFAPVVDPIPPTRRSKTRKRHHIAAAMVSLEPIRAASVRAFHKCVAVTKQVGPPLQRLPAALDRSWRATSNLGCISSSQAARLNEPCGRNHAHRTRRGAHPGRRRGLPPACGCRMRRARSLATHDSRSRRYTAARARSCRGRCADRGGRRTESCGTAPGSWRRPRR